MPAKTKKKTATTATFTPTQLAAVGLSSGLSATKSSRTSATKKKTGATSTTRRRGIGKATVEQELGMILSEGVLPRLMQLYPEQTSAFASQVFGTR